MFRLRFGVLGALALGVVVALSAAPARATTFTSPAPDPTVSGSNWAVVPAGFALSYYVDDFTGYFSSGNDSDVLTGLNSGDFIGLPTLPAITLAQAHVSFSGSPTSGTFTLDPGVFANLWVVKIGNNGLVLWYTSAFNALSVSGLTGTGEGLSGIYAFNSACSPTGGDCAPPPNETPIPGAAFLMGSVLAGGAGFGAWRRRRRTA